MALKVIVNNMSDEDKQVKAFAAYLMNKWAKKKKKKTNPTKPRA